VLLLDGHGTRFGAKFLRYCDVKRSNTPWAIIVGVPNATHIWQSGDAKELNGAYKHVLHDSKQSLYKFKALSNLPANQKVIVKTDIIPLINKAYEGSFGKVANVKKALAARGLNPLNRALLKDSYLLSTREDHPDVEFVGATSASSAPAPAKGSSQQPTEVNVVAAATQFNECSRFQELAAQAAAATKNNRRAGVSAGTHDVRPLDGVGMSSGKLWKAGVTMVSDGAILDEQEMRTMETEAGEEKTEKRAFDLEVKRKKEFDDLMAKKPQSTSWGIGELKAAIAYKEGKASTKYNGWDKPALLKAWNDGIKDFLVMAPSVNEERAGKKARQEKGGVEEQAEAVARFQALSYQDQVRLVGKLPKQSVNL
jgi:hypothetical protein